MANFNISTTGANRKTALEHPGGGVFRSLPSGITVNTTASGTSPLDTAGDFLALFDVPDGAHIDLVIIECAALDTGASLDLDVILKVGSAGLAAGGGTDTTLWNAGAAFQSAVDKRVFCYNQHVDATGVDGRFGQVGLEVQTAAATGVAAGAIDAMIWYH